MSISADKPYAVHNGILLHKDSLLAIDEAVTRKVLERAASGVFRLEFEYVVWPDAYCDCARPHPHDIVDRLNGSGFLAARNRIVTAAHVQHYAGQSRELSAVSVIHGAMPAEMLKLNIEKDLAVLSIGDIPQLPLAIRPASEPLSPGELCFAIGFPADCQDYSASPNLIVSPGVYLGTMPLNANGMLFLSESEDDLSRPVYHFAMTALNGQSGCPVVDLQGRVIGIYVAGQAWWNKAFVQPLAQGLNEMVSWEANYLRGLL